MSRLYTIGSTPNPVTARPLPAGLPSYDPAIESRTRLVDAFGRRLTYLRVSVTDRCNLRCTYCLPEDAEFPFGDRDFLSAEEIETMVGALVRLGIDRVRLTGGEPLVRRDLLEIVRRVKALPGVRNLALSTNGTELARLAPALKAAGVDRVNISLDTLDPEGVEAALDAGLDPVKLNAVLTGEESLTDADRLVALTLDRPLAVRFIEMMPTASNQRPGQPGAGRLPTCDDIRQRIEARFGPLAPAEPEFRTGPAKSFRLAGAAGTVGFITPLSHTFCAECNRLRLSARGELRLCLFAERNYPLRPCLTASDPAAALEAEILRVLEEKPAEHMLAQGDYGNLVSFMEIGG